MSESPRYVPPGEEIEIEVVSVDLVERPPSFEAFYLASVRRLFNALCLVTGNRHDAEDLAQEALVRVYERWERVAVLDDPTSYLFRVAMNLVRSRYRRVALGARRTPLLVRDETDELAAIEDRDVVAGLLRALTPRQRAAVVLTALLGYSADEAGRMLGMRASSVRAVATRARAQMKGEVVKA